MAYTDKPRLVLVKHLAHNGWKESKGKWLCHNDYYIYAQGDTVQDAYRAWLKRFTTFTTAPRRGAWNLRDTLDWYNKGCPPYRSYLGSKRIYGYLLQHDLLVLQG